MRVGEKFFKILEECNIDQIGQEMSVDSYSKKMTLLEHIKILVGMVIHQFVSLGDAAMHSDKHTGVIKISKSQLSKLNNKRDFTAFVYAYYELLMHPSNYRKFWRLRYFLQKKILGIDSTTIKIGAKLKLPAGECPLTEKESKGIKIQ